MSDNIKAPPHSVMMEQAVIACLMLGMRDAKIALARMDPAWFYVEKHRVIYSILQKHIEMGTEPDLPLALQWLTEAGVLAEVGGQAYLMDCLEACTTAAHVEAYVNELRKLYLDRQIVIAVYEVNREPSPENIEKLRFKAQERDAAIISGVINIADCMPKIVDLIQPMDKGLYELFGMEDMDKYHNGASPGNILTIAARPGVGKTVMSTHVAINFARKYKEPVLYFSTEMPHEETLQRILSPMSKVPGWKFRKRVFDKEGEDIKAIGNAAEELVGLKFYMVDKPSPTIADIRAAMVATKCKLVIVDYLQRMNLEVGHEGRPAAIGNVMMGIKNSCRDLGAIGIVISQMDRETDKLTGRQRPQLADLKGSGDIEQESDGVLLMWRHNKKDRGTKTDTVPDIDLIRPIEAIWAKNRHGTSDVSVQLVFDEKFIEFKEWNNDLALKLGDKIRRKGEVKKNDRTKNKWGTDSFPKPIDPDNEDDN